MLFREGEGNVYTTPFCFICARECELLNVRHRQEEFLLALARVMGGERCEQVREAPRLLLLSCLGVLLASQVTRFCTGTEYVCHYHLKGFKSIYLFCVLFIA